MSDIVERLSLPLPSGMCGESMGCNAASICLCSEIEDGRETMREAADEIQSLRQRVERLEGALRFYACLDDWDEFRADEAASAFDRNFGSKLGSDMGRTARAALSPKVQEGE